MTTVDRPAAAPPTGPYDLMVYPVAHPSFVPGLTAAINLLGEPGCIRKLTLSRLRLDADVPAGHRGDEKAERLYQVSVLFPGVPGRVLCVLWAGDVCVSTIMLQLSPRLTPRYCGQYVASPSLGSAGGTIEKVAYGIAIPGLIMTSTLWSHVAAKYVSARELRHY